MLGDEAALYQALAGRLERIVARDIRAPQPVIEDACQHAWAQFLSHSDTIGRQGVLSWLATTAQRRAIKLARREQRELSLEQQVEQNHEPLDPAAYADPAQATHWRSELDRLATLSQRQRRLVWLQAVGLTYTEIAARTGDSERTVQRQLLRARRTLKTTRPQTPQASPAPAPQIGDLRHQVGVQPLEPVQRHQRTVRP